MLKEFREFALKGNVVDLAVGVIIGAAFGKIIDSMVADIFLPIIAGVFGSPDFSNLYARLNSAIPAGLSYADARKVGPVFGYGQFITVTINFLIIAAVLFLVIQVMNRLKRREEVKPVAPVVPNEEKLLMEIRDLLATRP